MGVPTFFFRQRATNVMWPGSRTARAKFTTRGISNRPNYRVSFVVSMHNIGLLFINFTAGYITQFDGPHAAPGRGLGSPVIEEEKA